VAGGSFTIDGKTISVDPAADTIQTLITRINASGARVQASYDASTDKITLQATYNSEDNVPAGSDTSGFLAAAHLDTNNTVKGNLRDDLQVLSKTSQFGGVTSGTFKINGKTITVDASQDTLDAVITRINSAGAGVTATLNSSTNKIDLTGTSNSEELITVGDDTTGFLSAAKLATNNTVRGNLRDDQQALTETTRFAAVTSGTFKVNGVSISVNAGQDTLLTVVDKINSANAGITASYNAAADKVELQGTPASGDVLVIGDDTTGLLAAAGINSDNTVRGKRPDNQEPLLRTSRFAAVTNGSFNVNGVSISVNSGTDTLETLIGRINSAGAGVTASYSSSSDKLTFTPAVAGATLSIESDTSGFLAAAKISEGTAGSHVNADAAFNASGLNGPLFDPGMSVGAGSFSVNGVTITVAANDTVNTVLARISASGAGVAASYDDAAQTVKLTSKQKTGSPVTIENDTSGFLAALKFNQTATSTTGTAAVAAFDSAIREMSEYSSVHSGTLTVNGHQIAINPTNTTIRGLVNAVNGVQGLSAKLDETLGTIQISSLQSGETIDVADSSGILSTLGLAAGSYRGAPGVSKVIQIQTGTKIETNAAEVADAVSAATNKLNDVLSQIGQIRSAIPQRSEIEVSLQRAIDALVAGGAKGLDITTDASGMRLSVDRRKLAGSLDGLIGDGGDPGSAVAGLLDKFSDQTVTLASKAVSEPERPNLSSQVIADKLKAQVSADHISSTLNLLRTLLPASKSASTSASRASDAASRYALMSSDALAEKPPLRIKIT
jgi:flagellar hook-associated protein 2